jgi:hypothetical protein
MVCAAHRIDGEGVDMQTIQEAQATLAKLKAAAKTAKITHGPPCRVCGSTERYVATHGRAKIGRCKPCAVKKNTERIRG